jgi:GrpB-like predicted nucleotidyltransferase (UPF0157 family)
VIQVDEPITLEHYDPTWPVQFAREAARLRNGHEETVRSIEHIGSTAVAGLAAKPIVDVMIGVDDLSTTKELARQLAALGYEDCGGAEGRRYFRKRGNGQHFNVQVMEYRSPEWRASILFRDYLRSDDDAMQRYSDAKQAAVNAAPTLLAYSARKARIIEELLGEARAPS